MIDELRCGDIEGMNVSLPRRLITENNTYSKNKNVHSTGRTSTISEEKINPESEEPHIVTRNRVC